MSVDYRPDYDPANVDSNYGHTGGDITVPTFTGDTRPFRFWCQKALPLVYDDSLSYYEVLCKMADYMNNFMTDLTTVEDSMTEFGEQFVINQQFLNDMADQLGENVADLEAYINDRMDDFMTAYTQLQTYVNTYFDNLDVQEEINSKLDEMASDGTLNDLFDPVLETWMQQKTAQIDAAISNQNEVQAAQNGRISVLEGRMDTFEGLPAGSTAGNAELVGIRTNFLGEVYPTAGDAVRASDMIASGFTSIPLTRLEEWNGNEASSTYDTIQFDVSAYKGGHIVMIANMESFVSTAESIGVGVVATNVSGKTADQNAHEYALTSNVFPSYSVIQTQISGEERIALFFSIPEDFSYQYLKMGYVEEIPNSDYTQPAAIVYANSWSKTQVDPTLTIAGDAADAKAAGDAIGELNERFNPLYYELDLSLVANSYWPSTGSSAGIPSAYNGWSRTNRIPCVPGELLYINTTVASSYNVFFNTDTDGDVNRQLVLSVGENIVRVPDNAFYFALSNTTAGMEATTVKHTIRGSDVTTLEERVDTIEGNTDEIPLIEAYVGMASNEIAFPVSSLVATTSKRCRAGFYDTSDMLKAITVDAVEGFQHNINYYKVTTADGIAEAGWQTNATTFAKPDDTYKHWYVNFRKSDDSDFSSADISALLSGLNITLRYEVFNAIKTVYVASTGSDSNDGSKLTPYATLQKAVNSDADIIRVKAGEYAGFTVSGREKPLTIMLDDMPTSYSINVPDVPKIKIVTGIPTYGYGVYVINCAEIKLSDVWVSGVSADCYWIENVGNVYCERCYADGNELTDNSMGFRIINCNGTFKDCVAWDINKDGFNIHKYGNTEFINCVAHDCGDDGISHHDGCTGLILGGEYYNCYKGGVSSPYGGAKIDIYNAYIHDCTQYGIYSMSSSEMLKSAGRISNCVIKNNGTYDIIATYTDLIGWNNIYDSKSVGTQATFTEY